MRIGTAAMTSRGFGPDQFLQVAQMIDNVIINNENESIIRNVGQEVKKLASEFPLYSL